MIQYSIDNNLYFVIFLPLKPKLFKNKFKKNPQKNQKKNRPSSKSFPLKK